MLSMIQRVSEHLLVPSGLQDHHLDQLLHTLMSTGADDGDLYFQSLSSEHWILEDGIVKEGFFSLDRGVGIRAVSGEKTGLAYSNDLSKSALEDAVVAARGIVNHSSRPITIIQPPQTLPLKPLYISDNPLHEFTDEQKINLLRDIDQWARSRDRRVKQVMASLSASFEMIYIVTSDGQRVADIRPLVRFGVNVVVEDQGVRESAHAGGGGRFSCHDFLKNDSCREYANEAVRQALLLLSAKPAPAGEMPVVLGPGWPGVLLHEAIGHGLEGDFNRKGSSAFSGRLGTRVASKGITIVDNGTLAHRRGSLSVDDEGTPTQCTTLIEDGILKGYMQDKLNARLMNQTSTGNGRRQSYAHLPMPRMTNTYMLAGSHSPEEMIASVDKGLYAVNFGGGQVDITSGKFVFSASEAYLIENGKITTPLKGATLIGHGPDVLTKVEMVGHDLKLDSGVGTCGKEGQSVPVGVGQPTLKISRMTIGGVQEKGASHAS